MTDTIPDMLEALAEWADSEAKLDRLWKDSDIPGPYARLAALLRTLSDRFLWRQLREIEAALAAYDAAKERDRL